MPIACLKLNDWLTGLKVIHGTIRNRMADFVEEKSPPANWRAMEKAMQLKPERTAEIETAAGSQV